MKWFTIDLLACNLCDRIIMAGTEWRLLLGPIMKSYSSWKNGWIKGYGWMDG